MYVSSEGNWCVSVCHDYVTSRSSKTQLRNCNPRKNALKKSGLWTNYRISYLACSSYWCIFSWCHHICFSVENSLLLEKNIQICRLHICFFDGNSQNLHNISSEVCELDCKKTPTQPAHKSVNIPRAWTHSAWTLSTATECFLLRHLAVESVHAEWVRARGIFALLWAGCDVIFFTVFKT